MLFFKKNSIMMKTLKFTIFLFLTISLVSCGSDDDEPAFILSNANVAGTYSISSYNEEAKETVTSLTTGETTTISTVTKVGKTFQIDFVVNTNDTYTVTGQHVFDNTIVPTPSTGKPDDTIFNYDLTESYQLNTTARTITFNPSNDTFISGTFSIESFSENNLNLAQEKVVTTGGITLTTNSILNFTRNQ
jgi:hypothetical protein